MTRQEFINTIKSMVYSSAKTNNLCCGLCMAQAILESADGNSELATNANNLHGMKWTESYQTQYGYGYYEKASNEVINGVTQSVVSKFIKFNSWKESIEFHCQKFVTESRYAALVGMMDYSQACQTVYDCGYATDSQYPAKLISLIETYNLNNLIQTGWIQEPSGKWMYVLEDGTYASNCWKYIGNNWYRFVDIYMVTGWWLNTTTNKWYYLRADGKMHVGWWDDGGTLYYLKPDIQDEGAMIKGWYQIDGKLYCFSGTGAMYKGFFELDGNKYYSDSVKGVLAGYFQVAGYTYCSESSGRIRKEPYMAHPTSEGIIY